MRSFTGEWDGTIVLTIWYMSYLECGRSYLVRETPAEAVVEVESVNLKVKAKRKTARMMTVPRPRMR